MGATESGVFTLAREAGIELDAGTAFPWLSNRGHLNPILAGVVPETTLGVLSTIHQRLGGDSTRVCWLASVPAQARGRTSFSPRRP